MKHEKQLDLAKTRDRKGKALALVFTVKTYAPGQERLESPIVSVETVTLDSTLVK
jgi:hypothetical protein